MGDILPDIIRSSVTDIMFAAFLMVLSRPKHRLRTMLIPIVIMIAANVTVDSVFYQQGDHMTPVYVGAFLMIPWCIAMKPLIRDSVMQWCFDVLTAGNLLGIVIFISYRIAHLTPVPEYADTLVRVALFAAAIIGFLYRIRPLYLRVVSHWGSFLPATVGLFACFVFEYGFTGGVEQALTTDTVFLMILSATAMGVYASIFLALAMISRTYQLHDAANVAELRQEALQAELVAEKAYVDVARRSRHDQRHHDAVVLEYLERGNASEAIAYLHGIDETMSGESVKRFCENDVANALLHITERRCGNAGTRFNCNAKIPEKLPLSPKETGELLGNMLENACEACEAATTETQPCITFNAGVLDNKLLIEESNDVSRIVEFHDDMPVSTKTLGNGIGTESIRSVVEHVGGMVRFSITNGEFVVCVVIPL